MIFENIHLYQNLISFLTTYVHLVLLQLPNIKYFQVSSLVSLSARSQEASSKWVGKTKNYSNGCKKWVGKCSFSIEVKEKKWVDACQPCPPTSDAPESMCIHQHLIYFYIIISFSLFSFFVSIIRLDIAKDMSLFWYSKEKLSQVQCDRKYSRLSKR